MSARKVVVGALAALTLFTAFDTGMRRDQARLCQFDDATHCPTHLWWFDRPCETDGECEAVAGPF